MIERPKVWFVHEPLRFDRELRKMVPMRNLQTAAEYGDIVFALQLDGNRPHMDLESMLVPLRGAMSFFRAADYLVLAGDSHLFALATVLACRAIGPDNPIRLLKWAARAPNGGRYMVYSAKP